MAHSSQIPQLQAGILRMPSSHLWNEGEKEGKEKKETTWLLVAIKLAWLIDCNLFIYLFI